MNIRKYIVPLIEQIVTEVPYRLNCYSSLIEQTRYYIDVDILTMEHGMHMNAFHFDIDVNNEIQYNSKEKWHIRIILSDDTILIIDFKTNPAKRTVLKYSDLLTEEQYFQTSLVKNLYDFEYEDCIGIIEFYKNISLYLSNISYKNYNRHFIDLMPG